MKYVIRAIIIFKLLLSDHHLIIASRLVDANLLKDLHFVKKLLLDIALEKLIN